MNRYCSCVNSHCCLLCLCSSYVNAHCGLVSLLFMCECSLWFAVSLLFMCGHSLWFGVSAFMWECSLLFAVFTVHVWTLMSLLFMCECSLWFAVFLLFIWKCSLLFGLNRWTWSRMHWLHLQAQTSLWNHSLSLKVRRCMHTHYRLSFIQVMHLPVTKLKGHFFTLRAQAYWS